MARRLGNQSLADAAELFDHALLRRLHLVRVPAVDQVEDERDSVRTEQGACDHLATACVVDLVPVTEDELEPSLRQGQALAQVVSGLLIQVVLRHS